MPTPLQYYTAAVLGLAAFSAFKSASADVVTVKNQHGLEQANIPGKCMVVFKGDGTLDYFQTFECSDGNTKVKERQYSDCQCTKQTGFRLVDSGATVMSSTYTCDTSKTVSEYVESAHFSDQGCSSACNYVYRPVGVCLLGNRNDQLNGAGKSYKYTRGTGTTQLTVYDDETCSTSEMVYPSRNDNTCTISTGSQCADGATDEKGEDWKSNQGTALVCSIFPGAPCASTNYRKNNVCTACPSGHTCDGAVATSTSTSAAATTRSTALVIWATVASLLIFFPL